MLSQIQKQVFTVSSLLLIVFSPTLKAFTIDQKDANLIFTDKSHHSDYQNLTNNFLPGIGFLGSSFSLLKGFTSISVVGPIIQYEFNGNNLTPDQKYTYPDGFIYGGIPFCAQNANSFTVQTYNEFKSNLNSSFSISGKYKELSGSYATENQSAKVQINKYNSTASYSNAVCIQYNLSLIQPKIKLATWYLEELNNLPQEFNQDTQYKYFDFFDNYGDAVITGCKIGGEISQSAYTSETYFKHYGLAKTSSQAKASFLFSIDKGSNSSQEVTTEFTNATTSSQIINSGGIWPSSREGWNDWVHSVQNLENIACLHWSALTIPDLLQKIHYQDSAKIKSLQAALEVYFHRPGCTNPKSPNYNPNAIQDDGSCQKSYVKNCTHLLLSRAAPQDVIQKIGDFDPRTGSLWLVKGPHPLRNDCLISYAYQSQGPGKTSAEGLTGKVESGPQLLYLQRSDDFCYRYAKEFSSAIFDSTGNHLEALGQNHTWLVQQLKEYSPGSALSIRITGENYGKGCRFAYYGFLSQPYSY